MTGSTDEHTPAGGNSVPGSWDITSSVGITALAVAAARADEAERPDALVRDRHAAAFVRAVGAEWVHPGTTPGWSSLVDMLAVRSTTLDDLLLSAAGDGIRQVVVLAAGLDARSYRLAWPAGTTVHEVDQPPVLEFKQQVLDASGAQPACDRRPVPSDLRDDWPGTLADTGFDPSARTVWLVEGLLPYLPAQAEADLFATVDKLSAPGSRMAVECFAQDHAHAYVRRPEMAELSRTMGCDMTELWNTEPRPDTADTLRGAGWTTSARWMSDLGAELGRSFTGELGALAGRIQIVDASRA